MKKYFLLSFVASLVTAPSFAQISNPSFETWTNMGTYVNPASWGNMNNATTPLGVYTAEQGTPGNPGSYYLKLTSKTVGPAVVNGIAVCGVLDSSTMMPKSGFAFNMQPKSFTGSYQHMIFGSSQGAILVSLTKWNTGTNSRDVIATANQTLSGMAMSWTNFTINFTYLSSALPDTCIIFLKASGSAPTNNDYLWVDNLAFSGSVAGINEHNDFLTNMNVYPNPTTENIVLDLNFKTSEQTTIELTDVTGKVILSKNAGELSGESKQTLNITGVAKGSYFVRVITAKGTETKKIIVE